MKLQSPEQREDEQVRHQYHRGAKDRYSNRAPTRRRHVGADRSVARMRSMARDERFDRRWAERTDDRPIVTFMPAPASDLSAWLDRAAAAVSSFGRPSLTIVDLRGNRRDVEVYGFSGDPSGSTLLNF